MAEERRLYQRLPPTSPQLVLLDESRYSLLCDLSEGGVAVEGFAVENPERPISVEFDVPESGFCVQAKAEMTWTSDSGYRTGFRFVGLAEGSRQRLRDWVAASGESRTPDVERQAPADASGAAAGDSDSQPARLENDPANMDRPQAFSLPFQPRLDSHGGETLASEDDYDADSEGSNLPLRFISIAAVVMSATAFILGYYWRSGRPRTAPAPMAEVSEPVLQRSAAPNDEVVRTSEKASQNAIPPVLPLDTPGFVLQVGAMGEEANADALSNELHKKNFSAFVYHRDRDRYYRVVVGPYTDQNAAVRIKSDLTQEGYKSILRPWSPQ